MGLREVAQQNRLMVAATAVILFICIVVWMTGGGNATPLSAQVYFYDVADGTLFNADRESVPPIDAPSGPGNGVKAVVYGCGDCSESNRKIALLTTYSEDAKQAMATLESGSEVPSEKMAKLTAAIQEGTLAAAVPAEGQPQWVSTSSSAGIALLRQARDICADQDAAPCSP